MRNGDILMLGAFAAAPWVATLAPLGLAPLFALAAVGSLIGNSCRGCRITWSPAILACLMILPAWALLSAAWAPDPGRGIKGAIVLALELLGVAYLGWRAGVMADDLRLRILRVLAISMIASSILLWIEGMWNGVIWRATLEIWGADPWRSWIYNRVACVLALFFPLVAQGLWIRQYRTLAMVCMLACMAAILVLDSGAALAAVLVGAAVWCIVYGIPRRVAGPLAALVIAMVFLLAPAWVGWLGHGVQMLEGNDVPFSTMHRLRIWDFAVDRILEHPFWGWGMDASRVLPEGFRQAMPNAELMPLHPHNFILQIWLELGLVGVAVVVMGLGFVALQLARPADARLRAGGMAGMATALMAAAIGYGIWQSWWVAALALSAVLGRVALTPPSEERG